MKNTYKSLMALAAALLLATPVFAQYEGHEDYVENTNKKVALNKYLVSNSPNDAGEYTLRLENFVTGSVSAHAVPVDFVLVIDNSGSMLEDCLFGNPRPMSVTSAQMADPESPYYNFLRPAHTPENLHYGRNRYSANYAYNGGNLGQEIETSSASGDPEMYQTATWSYFQPVDVLAAPSLYYYFEEDDTYYKIDKEFENLSATAAQSTWPHLYFTRTNGQKKYIYSSSATNIVVSDTPPAHDQNLNKFYNQIILIGYPGDNLYRPINRVEELQEGYETFIQSIYDHNQNDHFAEGVIKHQVAIVSFSQEFGNGGFNNPPIQPLAHPTTWPQKRFTQVIRSFAEINGSTFNSYKDILNTSPDNSVSEFNFLSGTHTNYGMCLAEALLKNLQGQANMSPITSDGNVNRKKVVVLFTDGEPKPVLSTGILPTNAQMNRASKLYTVQKCLNYANNIKTKRTNPTGNQINGEIFTIDYAGSEGATNFLKHLSSNYLNDVTATAATPLADDEIMGRISYTGTLLTPAEDRIYWMDADKSGGLKDAFESIADASTGLTSAHIVAVDVLSDSFELPEGLTPESDKIKFYTAQCIGKKTIGESDYLAFAQPVPAGSRPAVEEIWFNTVDETTGAATWTRIQNLVIDDNITCVINTLPTGKKQLVIKGFDFANLWCGLDEDSTHHNTRQIDENDPNAGYQVDGYRGFKLIVEFPIVVAEEAVGGPNVPTNDYSASGFFGSDDDGEPVGDAIFNYPKPQLTIPIKLIIQKTGLLPGESASFTIERKPTSGSGDWTEFTTFVLTGDADGNDNTNPEIRFVSLDPTYYYRVKESGWSWAYTNADPTFLPSTEDPDLVNPITFENTPTTEKRAEAKAVNKMRATGSSTETVYDETK